MRLYQGLAEASAYRHKDPDTGLCPDFVEKPLQHLVETPLIVVPDLYKDRCIHSDRRLLQYAPADRLPDRPDPKDRSAFLAFQDNFETERFSNRLIL